MMQRCYNPKSYFYYRYGGRGISVCDRWHDFDNFIADMGNRPSGLSLDRINNDGNYEPSNCRWATKEQQASNKHHNTGKRWDALEEPKVQTKIYQTADDRKLLERLAGDNGWSFSEAVSRGLRLLAWKESATFSSPRKRSPNRKGGGRY